ncbi:MAG: phage Gp37/Gp68 family protein [Omnitrophica bacterium]|nr:phage Gp37/Gp68 family protein [Candidatus Omnitrophota bacterium]
MNNVSKTIGWAEKTWNPVTGCLNNCPYCYARKIGLRFTGHFKPTFHSKRLSEPYSVKPSKIFVCSMADLFAPWIPKEWIEQIIEVIKNNPQHTFMFLTKYPLGYRRIRKYPKNCWLGVTVTRRSDWFKVAQMHYFERDNIKFVSIEPILDCIDTCYFWLADWIILGGLTPKPVHKSEWIEEFLDLGSKLKTPVFMKSNLKPIWKGKLRQEFPLQSIFKKGGG